MTRFQVLLDVDGDEETEIVQAPDAKLAMTKALKAHPVKVLAVTPLDVQTSLDEVRPEDHPGQTTVDDVGEEVDPGMARVADEFGPVGATAWAGPTDPPDLMDRLKESLADPQVFKGDPGEGPAPAPIDPEERARAEAPVVGPFEEPEEVSLDDLDPTGEAA